MGSKMIIAIVLIAVGVLALAYQGFSYTTRERVADIGPIKVDKDTTHTVPIAPIAGGIALAGGVVLLLMSRKTA